MLARVNSSASIIHSMLTACPSSAAAIQTSQAYARESPHPKHEFAPLFVVVLMLLSRYVRWVVVEA
jgi:hypothetical protein